MGERKEAMLLLLMMMLPYNSDIVIFFSLSLSLLRLFCLHHHQKEQFSHQSISHLLDVDGKYGKQFAMKNWHTRHNNMKIIKRRKEKCATYNICAFGSEERMKEKSPKAFFYPLEVSKEKKE